MDNYVSIIIPTMWKSKCLEQMLPIYDQSEYVKEIILIDNDPKAIFIDKTGYNKLVYYTENKNLFVNPSWNKGSELAKYNLIIANDDILIKNVDEVLKLILMSDFDVVGVSLRKRENGMCIVKINAFPANNYGCFMFVKNYKKIPEELKIWYGDRYLFKYNSKKGWLINGGISTNSSTTINSDKYFRNEIGKQDRINFHIMKKERRF